MSSTPLQMVTRAAYRPAVDGLRAVAVLAVLVYHMRPEWWPSGYLGVDVFFVISGYVVTLSLVGQSLHDRKEFLLRFYVRRVKRLLPALAGCVVVAGFLAALVMYPGALERLISFQTGVASLFGFSNLFLLSQHSDYFGIAAELNLFLHTWSLGVEFQFYLLYPFIWLIAAGRRRLLLSLMIGGIALSWSLQQWLLYEPDGFNPAFYLMPCRFWEIGLGALAALLPISCIRQLKKFPRVISFAAFSLLAGLVWAVGFGTSAHPLMAVPVAAVLTSLLLALVDGSGPVIRLLSQPPLVVVGLRSYGLYLWHWPLLVLARWTLGLSSETLGLVLILTVLLTEVSYRWIEQPLRHWHWRPRPSGELAAGFAGASLGAALLTGFAVPGASAALWLGRDRRPGFVPPVAYPHLAYAPLVPGTPINRQDCFERFSFTTAVFIRDHDLSRCRVAPTKSGAPTVFLYGDSYAGHLSPLMAELRRDHGVGLEIFIRARCPFPARQAKSNDPCYQFELQRRERVLQASRPGDVLLLATSAREPGGRYSSHFLAELSDLSQRLKHRGVRVVLQSPLPQFPGSFDPICTYPLQWYQPGAAARCSRVSTRSRFAEQRRLAPLLAQLQPLIHRGGLQVWDAFAVLCSEEADHCSTHSGPARLYRDDGHLSARGAAVLTPSLERLLFLPDSSPTSHTFTGSKLLGSGNG